MKTWTRLHPKAKKTHRCEMCSRTIRVGETYMRGSGYGDGEAFTWKECAHCELYAQLIGRRHGEEEYSFDLLAEWNDLHTVAEARVRAQFLRRWTNLAGDLYPIPRVVITYDSRGFGRPTTIEPGQVAA